MKKHWLCSWNPPVPHHRIQDQLDCPTGTLRREQNPMVLRGSVARRRISIISIKSVTRAPRETRTGTYGTRIEHHKEGDAGNTWSYTAYTVQSQIDNEQCHTQTHPQVKKCSSLTARWISLRCVSAAEHHTAEQYSKTGRTKLPSKHLPRSIMEFSPWLPKVFEKLLWQPSEDASQMSSWNTTSHNISRSSDSFSTVPPIVNGGDCGCVVRVLETNDRTRNNEAKLIVKHFNTSVAQHFCPIKITTTWNALPSEVVSSRTVNSFKNSLDKHWAENPSNVQVNW